ncbi:MAG: hypothetical protein WC378_16785 [Opitutaceae bacterium]
MKSGDKMRLAERILEQTKHIPVAPPSLETVFDHKPTREELHEIFIVPPNVDEYRAAAYSQDLEYAFIYQLYELRGEKMRALGYLACISDKEIKVAICLWPRAFLYTPANSAKRLAQRLYGSGPHVKGSNQDKVSTPPKLLDRCQGITWMRGLRV